MSKYDALWAHIAKSSEDTLLLGFAQLEELAGVPLDHAFLRCKKELTAYGWQVEKISMKAQTVRFRRTASGEEGTK